MSDTTLTPDTPAPSAAPGPEAEAAEHPWTHLPLEQPTILRLAPLPTDANLGVRPLRFVEFVQAERHSPEQSLLRLVIRFPATFPLRNHNTLEIWADHATKTLRVGPAGGLLVDLPGRGLGRFLLAQGIAWAQQHWSGYAVEQGVLPVAGMRESDRLLRDQALMIQGFSVQYPDDPKLKPFYSVSSVSALSKQWNEDKVQILSTADAAGMLEQANQGLLEQDTQIRQLQERAMRFQREDGTLRFTIFCLVAFSLFQAGLLIWIATR